ncbi:MAG TPA: DUF4402 domain-containing protein [Holophagaceae bacterium]|nr:DUF4402 domain-containing protein [Holophagaceae bacterium]
MKARREGQALVGRLRAWVILALLGMALPAQAQNFTVTKLADMNLGTVNPAASAGSVTISTAGALSYVTVSGSGTGTAAQFQATNTNPSPNNLATNCTLPTGTLSGPGGTLATSAWTVNPTFLNLPNQGNSATFAWGVTVAIPANLAGGTYTGTFTDSIYKGNCAGQALPYTFIVTLVVASPISLMGVSGLDFGNLVSGATAGTVTVSPGGAVSSAGGVTLFGGAATACILTVAGTANRSYSVTLPANGSVTLSGPGTAMPVNGFLSNPSGSGNLGAGGSQALRIGATLSVAANQADGTYTGAFDVTVTYQ